MNVLIWILTLTNFGALIGLGALVLALVRRTSSVLANEGLAPDQHLDVGAPLPRLVGTADHDGRSWTPAELHGGRALVSILTPSCSICVGRAAELALASAALGETKNIVLYDAPPDQTAHIDRPLDGSAETIRFSEDPVGFRKGYRVEATPIHYVVEADGLVTAYSVSLERVLADLGVSLARR